MNILTSIVSIIMGGLTCIYAAQETQKIKPTGAISGTITLNGKPLAGARVNAQFQRARFAGERTQLTATTDAQGKFRISNLPSGTYIVSPGVPQYVTSDLSPIERTIVVNQGETVENTDFTLTRGSVITGRVYDSEGRPIIGEFVHISPIDPKLERLFMQSLPWEQLVTDDRGVYRVYGLPAGTYKLAIGNESGSFLSDGGGRPYQQTFHKNAIDEAQAKLVEVGPEAEVSNIDIEVGRRIQGFGISGKVVDAESGAPIAGVHFGLTRTTDGHVSFSEGVGLSSSSGTFQIDNVRPGRYVVSLMANNESAFYGESIPFDLIADDVTGVEIKARRAASVAGVIVLEGTSDKSVIAMLPQLQFHFLMRGQKGGGGYSRPIQLSINADGTFRINGLPGGMARVSSRLPSIDYDKFSVLRVERDGVEQTPGLIIKDGEQITGVRIVVGYGTGGLRGTVKLINGDFSPNLHLFAQLHRDTVTGALPVKYAQVDAHGRFVLEWLPPGNYQLTVGVYNPAVSDTPITVRQQVTITDLVVSEVNVSVDLKSGSSSKP